MNEPQLPTPYELARIAGALSAQGSAKSPAVAVQQAMALWNAAVQELDREQSTRSQEGQEERAKQYLRDRDAENQKSGALLLCDLERKQSPALDWVNENAKDERDKFKSIENFKTAFLRIFPGTDFYGGLSLVTDLRTFLERREEGRRKADRERKRKDSNSDKGASK